MPKSNSERQRAWRDRQRGGPPAQIAEFPHGTRAGAARHRRAGGKPKDVCAACHEAEKAYMRERARAKKDS